MNKNSKHHNDEEDDLGQKKNWEWISDDDYDSDDGKEKRLKQKKNKGSKKDGRNNEEKEIEIIENKIRNIYAAKSVCEEYIREGKRIEESQKEIKRLERDLAALEDALIQINQKS